MDNNLCLFIFSKYFHLRSLCVLENDFVSTTVFVDECLCVCVKCVQKKPEEINYENSPRKSMFSVLTKNLKK
jgi:hypothetical protein